MKCAQENCGLDATRCVRTTFLSTGHKSGEHFPICEHDYDRAQNGEALSLHIDDTNAVAGFGPGALFECTDPSHPLPKENQAMNESHDDVVDDAEQLPMAQEPAKRKPRVARGKPAKKKKATPAAAAEKIDYGPALLFVRAKLRATAGDLVAQAFWKQEAAALEEKAKHAAEQKRKNVFVTVADGKRVDLGTHVFEVEDNSGGYRSGRKAQDGVAVHEYVLKDVLEPRYQGAAKEAVFTKVGGGQKTLGTYQLKSLYTDRRAAIDNAINAAHETVKDADAQLDAALKEREALLALRTGDSTPTATSSNGDSDRAGKRWIPDEDAQLRELVAAGTSPEEIATQLGRARDRVVRRMHQLGIKAGPTENGETTQPGDDVVKASDDDEALPLLTSPVELAEV